MSKEFPGNILNLLKQKGSHPYEYRSSFEEFEEKFPSKENYYSSLTGE